MQQHDQHDDHGDPGDASAWLTRAEIARLAGKSDRQVSRITKAAGLEEGAGTNGAVTLRTQDCIRIGLLKVTDIPNGLTGTQAAEVLRLQQQVARLLGEKGEAEGRLAELRAAGALAQEQLKVKDKTISDQMALLAQLTAALKRSAA